jgi:hypothetical protein
MSIRSYVIELKNIDSELKSLRMRTRQLNKQKFVLEEKIRDFLREKEQPGVKFQGVAITLEEREKHTRKKDVQKKEDSTRVLERYGVQDTEQAYKELMEALKGEKIAKSVVKVRNLKQ